MKYLIVLIAICTALLFTLMGCSGKSPDNLGLKNGRFAICPDTDNCVSSQAEDEKHTIAPLKAHGTSEVVMTDLSAAIENMFGSKIVRINGNYLHAEFTTRVFRFVDDLECYYDEDKGVVEVRSASRIGYSDLNANRERVEELRRLFSMMQ